MVVCSRPGTEVTALVKMLYSELIVAEHFWIFALSDHRIVADSAHRLLLIFFKNTKETT